MELAVVGAEGFDPAWNADERGGAVLIAVGGDDPKQPMVPWRIGLAPDETGRSWIDFLDDIDPGGPGPEWVGASRLSIAIPNRSR